MTAETGSQYEGMFDAAAVVREAIDETYIVDATTGRFIYANDIALKNSGYSLDELRSMTPLDLQRGTDFETLAKRVEPLRQGDEHIVTFEVEYSRKDGSVYLVEHRVQFLRSQEPPVFVVRAREIAERKLPSSSLIEDPDLYRRIVEETVEGVWVIDAESITTYANETIAAMLGYGRQEMAGMSLFEFMDDEGKAIAEANVERRKNGIGEQHDFKFLAKDGSEVWTIIAAHPVVDGAGQYAGAVGFVTDITERKLRERALLDTLHVETPEELWGVALPPSGKPVVRMPEGMGVRASRVAKRFAILADPKRLELIELLASGEERTVTVLAESLNMTQSNVSKHLKVLSEAALVSRRQDGTKTYYALLDPTVAILCRIVCQWLSNQAKAEMHALAS